MNRRSTRNGFAWGALAMLALVATSISAFAQAPGVGGVPNYAAPFDMIGFLQRATVNSAPLTASASMRTRGGRMMVNNHDIVVPDNVVLQMPATSMTWADLFDPNSPWTNGGSQTGMALEDTGNKLFGTFEVHVQGSIVNGQYIAALIFISQQSLNSGVGFIDKIDYQAGDIYVNGTRIQINDPIGRFGQAHSPDPRFTIDEDNPTIHSTTGYPMCVPRSDPAVKVDQLCPEDNRPKNGTGGYAMTFTMPANPFAGSPNANLMAPFEVGDYITYAGILVPDGKSPNGYYISAYNIDANVGIYTAPGTDPSYVTIEEVLQGTGGIANPNFPQEATSRVKVVAFTTDASRTVSIFARDTNCQGTVTDRQPAWVSGLPVDPGPPTGAKKGRIRFLPNGGPFLPPAKEVHVVQDNNTQLTTLNGLVSGQYYAPIFDFIFPENLGIGDAPTPFNFQDFTWLVNGIGPFPNYTTVIGQLNPWPGLTTPSLSPGCPFQPPTAGTPVADAGPARTIKGLETAQLDGTGSYPAPNDPNVATTYTWKIASQSDANQPAGTLTVDPTNPQLATFTAPDVTSTTTYAISLTLSNANGTSNASTTVMVLPIPKPPIASLVATPNPAGIGNNVTLDGSGSRDLTGTPITKYTFRIISAPPSSKAVINQISSVSPTATFVPDVQGAYTFGLIVNNGTFDSTEAQATLNAGSTVQAPVISSASATPTTVNSLGNFSLNVSATDPQGLALKYTWKQLSGPAATIAQPTVASTSVTAPTNTGTTQIALTFAVTVSNGVASTTSAPVTVNVLPAPADSITITLAQYRTAKSRLTINATDSVISANVVLTATLDLINPTTGQPYSGKMINNGNGTYTIDFLGTGVPRVVTVTSNLGAKATTTAISVRN